MNICQWQILVALIFCPMMFASRANLDSKPIRNHVTYDVLNSTPLKTYVRLEKNVDNFENVDSNSSEDVRIQYEIDYSWVVIFFSEVIMPSSDVESHISNQIQNMDLSTSGDVLVRVYISLDSFSPNQKTITAKNGEVNYQIIIAAKTSSVILLVEKQLADIIGTIGGNFSADCPTVIARSQRIDAILPAINGSPQYVQENVKLFIEHHHFIIDYSVVEIETLNMTAGNTILQYYPSIQPVINVSVSKKEFPNQNSSIDNSDIFSVQSKLQPFDAITNNHFSKDVLDLPQTFTGDTRVCLMHRIDDNRFKITARDMKVCVLNMRHPEISDFLSEINIYEGVGCNVANLKAIGKQDIVNFFAHLRKEGSIDNDLEALLNVVEYYSCPEKHYNEKSHCYSTCFDLKSEYFSLPDSKRNQVMVEADAFITQNHEKDFKSSITNTARVHFIINESQSKDEEVSTTDPSLYPIMAYLLIFSSATVALIAMGAICYDLIKGEGKMTKVRTEKTDLYIGNPTHPNEHGVVSPHRRQSKSYRRAPSHA